MPTNDVHTLRCMWAPKNTPSTTFNSAPLVLGTSVVYAQVFKVSLCVCVYGRTPCAAHECVCVCVVYAKWTRKEVWAAPCFVDALRSFPCSHAICFRFPQEDTTPEYETSWVFGEGRWWKKSVVECVRSLVRLRWLNFESNRCCPCAIYSIYSIHAARARLWCTYIIRASKHITLDIAGETNAIMVTYPHLASIYTHRVYIYIYTCIYINMNY